MFDVRISSKGMLSKIRTVKILLCVSCVSENNYQRGQGFKTGVEGVYIYMCIYRERERDEKIDISREREIQMYRYRYIYIYTYIHMLFKCGAYGELKEPELWNLAGYMVVLVIPQEENICIDYRDPLCIPISMLGTL